MCGREQTLCFNVDPQRWPVSPERAEYLVPGARRRHKKAYAPLVQPLEKKRDSEAYATEIRRVEATEVGPEGDSEGLILQEREQILAPESPLAATTNAKTAQLAGVGPSP
jgi:hypothetical protein